jgi:hypothetical protein
MLDPTAYTASMPPCLCVPIAAARLSAIATYVGAIEDEVVGLDGRVNAVLVSPDCWPPARTPKVGLWSEPDANAYYDALHPERQVWVHVCHDN